MNEPVNAWGVVRRLSWEDAQRGVGVLVLAWVALAAVAQASEPPIVEEGRAPANGIELYYQILGQGRPVVILHGGPGMDHGYLLPGMAALADTYQMIFYDQRAVGRSSGSTDEASLTVDNYVEDLEGLRKARGLETITLLGHSWGGGLAMFYAIAHPDRVDALILANSVGATSEFWGPFRRTIEERLRPEDRQAIEQINASEAYRQRTPEAVMALARVYFSTYCYDRAVCGRLRLDYTERTAANGQEISKRLYDARLGFYDIRQQVSRLSCPALIIHGDTDPIPVDVAATLHRLLPHSTFVVLPHCGHFPYLEVPEEFFRQVRAFLQQLPPSTPSRK